ncbi:MAG: catechol 2,3-dioxygenase-like lactoylglutathione lyase family enzyme [Gammaproteobacteria bacterium]|jgi:catechol 2,3-dioxygenase-like lactoylglutathione lyase family enzyme
MNPSANTGSSTLTQGAHHIGLTVPNINQTRDFFVNTLNFKQVGEKPNYPALFVSDGTIMVTLWQSVDPDNTKSFDRKNNIGLHHLALRLNTEVSIELLYERLVESENVDIEFEPEQLGSGAAKHMMCIIPGGIRVEFIAPIT